MKKIIYYIFFVVLNFNNLYAQEINHYQGNILVDFNKRILKAHLSIDLKEFSTKDTIKLHLQKASIIEKICSNSKTIPYKIIDESFIGEDNTLVIKKKIS
ncbi:hypothetical protein HSX10_18245 [Winogradskyella undariae]|uniref:hypothetical protein n=1 Tax=Winogradskyella undariae TaxID=1285465 RepID=UPI00156AA8E2|nr:hypothetical protein [Winogradskyella undariae]NRR93517.1 hypothetical protein [Winogradskyella undariae]